MIKLSEGNRKLKSDDNSFFLIWNLPAVTTCPGRTAECERLCYARKAERQYPAVLPSRERNLEASKRDDFVQGMTEAIRKEVNRKKNSGKQCFFRIHESGDFYSTEYFQKWQDIADALPEVIFLAYTKSIQQVQDYIRYIPNLKIRFSLWADTNPQDARLANALGLPVYTAYTAEEAATKGRFSAHCIGDCQKCKLCYVSDLDIWVGIH